MKLLSLFLFVLLAHTAMSANEEDTLKRDTVKVHSIRKAVIFSAVVPGSGQIYNHLAMPKGQKKAYWKVPLIYAGLGTMGYFAFKNNMEQRSLKEEYINRTEYGIYSTEYATYDDFAILQLYDQKLNRRDLFFLGLGLVYLIQVADAAVEAHFVNFDVSEDLTLSFRPAILPSNSVGLSLRINFH